MEDRAQIRSSLSHAVSTRQVYGLLNRATCMNRVEMNVRMLPRKDAEYLIGKGTPDKRHPGKVEYDFLESVKARQDSSCLRAGD